MLSKIVRTKYLSVWVIAAIDVLLSVLVSFLCLSTEKYMLGWNVSGADYAILLLASLITSALAFFACGLARKIIRYSRLKDVLAFIMASFLKAFLMLTPFYLRLNEVVDVDHMIFAMIVDAGFTFLLLMFVRSFMVYVYDYLQDRERQQNYNIQHILIYGVNKDSVSLSMRLRNNSKYKVVGFCSRSEHVKRYKTEDVPVFQYDSEEKFAKALRLNHVRAILFPTVFDVQKEENRLLKICESQKIKVLIAPPIDEFGNQKGVSAIREVEVEDILNRPEININMEAVKGMLKDKTIMVTGAAGSIGSEICRQLVKVGAGRIVAYEQAETPMHNLQLEFRDKFPHQRFDCIVGDVLNKDRLNAIFEQYRPQIVFHAAAYKHVPLMEENPCEAIRVNVGGSKNLADFSLKYNVEKMIMVSTDKAVNPTNIMGTSKRMAEIYVQSLGKAVQDGRVEGKTKFVTTRFGNVLGSNGSVLPRFREQIAKGGPVTVTHPDIIRFFMSIPEACRLVLQAGTIGQDNEI
ncbi:MAG: polysaccharide biosynthesis protein, partial [Bacteroidales bacterium]|nr:polysaccharide biosynthesis protein [Bacteroidales bacterium]